MIKIQWQILWSPGSTFGLPFLIQLWKSKCNRATAPRHLILGKVGDKMGSSQAAR